MNAGSLLFLKKENLRSSPSSEFVMFAKVDYAEILVLVNVLKVYQPLSIFNGEMIE